MSKRFKVSASSGRASEGGTGFGLSSQFSGLGVVAPKLSRLSYIQEPIDFTTISEPAIVVLLKNLQKKESVTKSKALEDLNAEGDGLDVSWRTRDTFLAAWSQIYPRLAIDNSGPVRRSAHTFHARCVGEARKGYAKHLSQTIPSWLAGTLDGDSTTKSAAEKGFDKVFATKEKRRAVWVRYAGSILDFARDVILDQSQLTLSDERTTSPDDAAAKYNRAAASSLLLIAHLLATLTDTEVDEHSHQVDDVLVQPKVWRFLAEPDLQLRRAANGLLAVASKRRKDTICSIHPLLAGFLMDKCLAVEQRGSRYEYLKNLEALTKADPQLWLEPSKNLNQRKRRLSQVVSEMEGSSGWPPYTEIIRALPPGFVYDTVDEWVEVLDVVLTATKRSRQGQFEGAWTCFHELLIEAASTLPSDKRWPLSQRCWSPLAEQLLKFPEGQATGPDGDGFRLITRDLFKVLDVESRDMMLLQIKNFMDENLASHREDPINSDSPTAEASSHIHDVLWNAGILFNKPHNPHRAREGEDKFNEEIQKIYVDFVVQLLGLVNRLPAWKSKPMAIGIVGNHSNITHSSVTPINPRLAELFERFMRFDLPRVLVLGLDEEKSGLCETFLELQGGEHRKLLIECLNTTVTLAVDQVSPPKLYEVLADLLAVIPKDLDGMEKSNEVVQAIVNNAIDNPRSEHDQAGAGLISAFLKQTESSSGMERFEGTFRRLLELKKSNANTSLVAQKLRIVTKAAPGQVAAFVVSEGGSGLFEELLDGATADSISGTAIEVIIQHCTKAKSGSTGQKSGLPPSLARKVAGCVANPESQISLSQLIQVAKAMIASLGTPALTRALIVLSTHWNQATKAALSADIDPLVMGLHPFLGGSFGLPVPLSREPSYTPNLESTKALRRIVLYTNHMLQASADNNQRTSMDMVELVSLLTYTEIMNDAFAICPAPNDSDSSEWQRLRTDLGPLTSLVHHNPSSANERVTFIMYELPYMDDYDAEAQIGNYYRARGLFSYLDSIQTPPQDNLEHPDNNFNISLTKSMIDSAHSVAVVKACTSIGILPEDISLFRSILVNELTGALNARKHAEIARLARILRATQMLPTGRRLEFWMLVNASRKRLFIREVLVYLRAQPCVEQPEAFFELMSLFEFWQELFEGPREIDWAPVVRLIMELSVTAISSGQTNKAADFRRQLPVIKRAWTVLAWLQVSGVKRTIEEFGPRIHEAQVDFLCLINHAEFSQLKIARQFTEFLMHMMGTQTMIPVSQYCRLFPLLATGASTTAHQTAFTLLHRYIPAAQEQISIDLALGDSSGGFLPEVLTLVVEIPAAEKIEAYTEDQPLDDALQSFTRTWFLLFDHYRNASFKLREGYNEQLQKLGIVPKMLDTILSLLTNPATGRVIHIPPTTSEQVSDANISGNPTTAFVQIFYLALLHIPSLSKAWYTDLKRGVKENAEHLTTRYVSPSLCKTELEAVKKWYADDISATRSANEEQKLSIRVSEAAKEAQLGYELDVDQIMSILIKLPPAWPLQNVLVESIQRVVVSEEKWNSWLRNTRGTITFSNGTLVDGISAWKQNVSGTLRGQSECAICYAIVSQERQLPTKRCATCRNLFHGGCLFKWFKSSNSSSCPLCRTAFQYG